MKKLLIRSLVIMFIMLGIYLSMIFYNLTINPIEWILTDRIVFMLVSFVCSYVYIIED